MKQRNFQDHNENGSINFVRANKQMTMAKIKISKERLAEFCRNNGIQKLSLFGSVLSDDFGPDCDVDVLVEFKPGTRIGLIRLTRLEFELSEIVGRKVDLNTPVSISPS